MSDKFNPKLRVKFLRATTITDTPVEPGNLIVDMDKGKVYIDILSSDNSVTRVNLSDNIDADTLYTKTECDNKFVAEDNLQDLIKMLDDAASEVDK